MALQAPKLQTPILFEAPRAVKAYPSDSREVVSSKAGVRGGGGRPGQPAYLAALAALSTLMVLEASSRVPFTVTLLPTRVLTLSKLSRS